MSSDLKQDTCPYRILDTAGGGFIVASLSAPYYAWRGAWQSPDSQRIAGAMRHVKTRTPVLMGSFAIWGLLMASFDCTLETLRAKSDPWNKIVAMGAVRGTLAFRAGPRVVVLRTIEGAVLWAGVELFGLVIDSYFKYQSETNIRQTDEFPRFLRDQSTASTTPDDQQEIGTRSTLSQPANVADWSHDMPAATVNKCEPTKDRRWVGVLVVAAAASTAHRYRHPLSQAATTAIGKFQKLR